MVNGCIDGPVIAKMLGWLETFDLENGRPWPADTLAAAALLQTDRGAKEFMEFFDEKDNKVADNWCENVAELFRGSGSHRDGGGAMKISTDVIRTLRLGN